MKCGKVRKKLVDYSEGMLGEAGRPAVERHLAGCEPCRNELSELEGLKKDLLSLKKPEKDSTRGAEFWERFDESLSRRLMGELEKEALAEIGRRRSIRFGLSPAAANVAVLVLILIFIIMGAERLGDAPRENEVGSPGVDVGRQEIVDASLSDEEIIEYFLSDEDDYSDNGYDAASEELALLMGDDLIEQVDEMVLSEIYEQGIYEYMEDFSDEELEDFYEGLASI
jgi:hypothetical protein